jgi:hypothetical protein
MKRMLRIVALAALWLVTTAPGLAQQRPQSQMQRPAQSEAQRARTLYQRRETWYEFLLKQFNPDNLDYGAWLEQRRHTFLDARLRNPYFGYSFGVTAALLLMAAVCTKLWIDHRRAMWITAEMMADVYNHDLYSREVAKEAIQKYNQHIEGRNRAIETAGHGAVLPGTESDVEQLRSELATVTGERDLYLRERDTAKAEVTRQKQVVVELSLRLDAAAKRFGTNGNLNLPVDLRMADQKLVQHINELQEQLCAAHKENSRLKGA